MAIHKEATLRLVQLEPELDAALLSILKQRSILQKKVLFNFVVDF